MRLKYLLTATAQRFISSWIYPQYSLCGQWSWCADRGHKGPKSGVAPYGLEFYSDAPGLHAAYHLDRWSEPCCTIYSSFTSFCLFKNKFGILNYCGFWMMVITRSTSPSTSSPALLERSTSALLNTTWGYLCPTPFMTMMAKAIFRHPSMLVMNTYKNVLRLLRDHQRHGGHTDGGV